MQLKSVNFLSKICQNFVKKEYLQNIATNIDFSQKQIQKNINEIFVGSQCEAYLNNLVIEDNVEAVVTIRQNCL